MKLFPAPAVGAASVAAYPPAPAAGAASAAAYPTHARSPRLFLASAAVLLIVTSATAQIGSAQSAPQSVPKTQALPEIRVECTPAAHASELVGQHGCVAGRVSRVTYTRTGATHLSLCPARSNGKCSFHAVALARDRDAVGDLSYLKGKIVAVIGDVKDYRGHPQIVVSNREQLQVAAGSPPAEFDAAQPDAGKNSPPTASHVRPW